MGAFSLRWLTALLLVALVWSPPVHGECECGYAVNATSAPQHVVFTDLIESDFRTIQDIRDDTDWKIQVYHKPPYDQHLGRNCTLANVVSNPAADNASLAGASQQGGDAGLQLWVRGGQPADGMVPSGELRTARKDILYGSIRAGMKLTPVNGTCSSVFSYFNDSQEIDIELLSRQYTGSATVPLNLVLHSIAALEVGHQTPNTSSYGVPELAPPAIGLTDGFHEYRFDWLPGRVSFYFDGRWIWDLADDAADVPREASSLLLSHWSNGAPGWSQGPPARDAVTTVSYFKAYFNSSAAQRQRDHAARCRDPDAPGAVCAIPDDPSAAVLFSQQQNKTANQTVYDGVSRAVKHSAPVGVFVSIVLASVVALAVNFIL